MTVGLHTANLANKILNNLINNTSWTAPTGLFYQLHIGDPGSAGTSNQSAVTTRKSLSFNAASGGAVALSGNAAAQTSTATETLSHISVWDASTSGNFLWSAAMGSTHAWNSGDTFTLTSCGVSLTPLAA